MKTKLRTCTNEFLEAFKRDFDEKYLYLYRNLDRAAIQKLLKTMRYTRSIMSLNISC